MSRAEVADAIKAPTASALLVVDLAADDGEGLVEANPDLGAVVLAGLDPVGGAVVTGLGLGLGDGPATGELQGGSLGLIEIGAGERLVAVRAV